MANNKVLKRRVVVTSMFQKKSEKWTVNFIISN